MPSVMSSPQAQSFNPISYLAHVHKDPPQFRPEIQSPSSSHISSPEFRPTNLQSPVFEEEDDGSYSAPDLSAATPTPSKKATKTPNPKTPSRPVASTIQKDSSIKRAVSGFFKRVQSQSVPIVPTLTQIHEADLLRDYGPEPASVKERRPVPFGRKSATNSPFTPRPDTPPSPESPSGYMQIGQNQHQSKEPSSEDLPTTEKKRARQSTSHGAGLNLVDRLTRHRITFAPQEKAPNHGRRHRATSVDLDSPTIQKTISVDPQLPERQIWGMAADSGTGLKSRRMSLSLPDNFMVDTVDLYSEYADQSKLVGRRGKSIGKGATAHVRLMTKRGGHGEYYAVKEFRGKSTIEKEEDYEKKVKSEFSIAKSAHHPNIVETFRLCTYNGRWNQVMEFCDQGDLFSLVSQKYLSQEIHLDDRVCLFKQLVQGLNYLHSHGIAHRDIKLENILVTRHSKLKITDFGVSEVFAGIHPGLRSAHGECGKDMGEIRLCAPGMCGSPPYVAPEVIAKTGAYDPRPLDVWGAGIVMLCMCANGVLWEEAKAGSSPLYDDLVQGWVKWNTKHADESGPDITETDYPHVSFFDQHIKPPALRRVLLKMLNPDPSKRATMANVVKNRWLKTVECCQVDSYNNPTTTIDVSKSKTNLKALTKVVQHNHLPPAKHFGHVFVRHPGE